MLLTVDKGLLGTNVFNIVISQRAKTVAELTDPTNLEQPHFPEFMADKETDTTEWLGNRN